DHLFAFEGDGVIRDFPGNYSQYRDMLREEEKYRQENTAEKVREQPAETEQAASPRRKMSYKERRELEQLQEEIPLLEKEKQRLESDMADKAPDFEWLQKSGLRIAEIIRLLEEKEMRWLELSEME